MANLLKNKWIGSDEVNGRTLLLNNAEFVRAKKADGTIANLFRLASDNRLIFEQAIVLTSAAAQSSEALALQTKGQVSADITVEANARIAADTALGGRIDNAEAAAALSSSRLTQEISDRTVADTALSNRIDTEITARTNADTTLGGRIDQEITDRNSAILVEKNRALAAEALLIPLSQKGAIDGVASLDNTGRVPSSQLPSFVDDVLEFPALPNFPVSGEPGKIYVAINTAKTYRWSGSTYIEISPSEVTSVNGKVGPVVLLTTDIAEGTNLYFTNARVSALVESRFTSLETTSANHGTRLVALETRLAPTWAPLYKKVITDADLIAGYVDLPHTIVANSLQASVDRIEIYEGAAEDYALSVVAGKTRVTFLNDLISSGQQALVAGSKPDNVYFKYQYLA